ncbi:MAG: DUF192 domain-containing protein [Patescibacteria group bacterium]
MTKKQIIIILILAVTAIFLVVFCFWRAKSNNQHANSQTKQVCYEARCFNVELATTSEEQERGLMERESLAADAGMLFVYRSEGDYPFWMKNTKIPLDMIWIDKDFKVVSMVAAEPCVSDPCRIYDPQKQAKYVLELSAGTAQNINLKEGDEVVFK